MSIDGGWEGPRCDRRGAARIAFGLLSAAAATVRGEGAPRSDDLAIDEHTALVFSDQAPLSPARGLRDARAVWASAPSKPDGGVLVYLHGHNGYVTVDAKGKSRVPDWAASDEAARAGASAKRAAPLVYGLDKLAGREEGPRPIVLVPEVSTLAKGSFWAKEPAGQYAEPSRLGALTSDALARLGGLKRPGGAPYVAVERAKRPERVFLAGHSGAGLPLEEAAVSDLIAPGTGVPGDLWLFDCTYWSKVDGFVRFCERWKGAGKLAGGRRDASRLVCVYRARTQTEKVADTLRETLAGLLGVPSGSLLKDHDATNFEAEVAPALRSLGVVFVRTHVAHDEIPTVFIPALLSTAPA